MKFKIGDRVRVLPSAVYIGVREREIDKVVEVRRIINLDEIMIEDSRGSGYGCWCVRRCDIIPFIKKGQQLLLWDDIFEVKI